jgi:hypothetical protein
MAPACSEPLSALRDLARDTLHYFDKTDGWHHRVGVGGKAEMYGRLGRFCRPAKREHMGAKCKLAAISV